MKVLIKKVVLREEQIFPGNLNKLLGIGRLLDFSGTLKGIVFSKSHENALKFQYGLHKYENLWVLAWYCSNNVFSPPPSPQPVRIVALCFTMAPRQLSKEARKLGRKEARKQRSEEARRRGSEEAARKRGREETGNRQSGEAGCGEARSLVGR